MKRLLGLMAAPIFVPAFVFAQNLPSSPASVYQPPSFEQRFQQYVLDAYGPSAILGAGITAGFDQIGNAPREWRQGAAGFGRRFGSRYGQFAIAETARFGLAAALHEDTRYQPCQCSGTVRRLGHALLSGFTARAADGHRVISVPDLAAPYVGALAATSAWYPGRFGPKDGLQLGTFALGMHVGLNVLREFVPFARR